MSGHDGRTVALTGATGFVGAETLDQLLAAGFSVRALARRPQPERVGVSWIAGALDDPASLDALVNGADLVLHIAGVVNAPNRAGFETGNSLGTANMITAAQRGGIQRFLHVSSVAAREPELSSYCWSKALAENHVRTSGLDWTMVRPPAVYGPRDTEFSEVLRVVRYGFLPAPSEGSASFIHVRDLAALLVALCGKAGDHYGGAIWEVDDNSPNGLSHRKLAAAFGRALNRNVRIIPLPKAMLWLLSRLGQVIGGPLAKLTPDRVRYMCHPDWVADEALRPPAAFWRPRIGIDEGFAEIAAAFRR